MRFDFLAIVIAASIVAAPSDSVHAVIVAVDLDASTPALIGIPPVTGLDTTRSVTSGTVITVAVYFFPSSSISFDSFGVDLNVGLPSDSATASLVPSSHLAGIVSGLGGDVITLGPPGMSIDVVSGALGVMPGTLLSPGGLAPFASFTSNIGGVGYHDPVSSSGMGPPPIGQFSSVAFATIPGTPFEIFTASYTITGSPGDVVTFGPSGIFTSGTVAAGTPATALTTIIGGDALYDSVTGATISTALLSSTITVVPEVSSFLYLGVVAAAIGLGRHLKRLVSNCRCVR